MVREKTDKTASDIQARSWGRNAKLKEKHKWAIEKKNQSSIMQEAYEESISLTLRIWRSRKSLKMQEKIGNSNDSSHTLQDCKRKKHGVTRSKTNDFKSKLACILEASESTRMRMEETLPKYHEDYIAGKGDISL